MIGQFPLKKTPKHVFFISLTSSDLSNGTYQLVALGGQIPNCNMINNANCQFPIAKCLFHEFLFVAKMAIIVRKI
jgi:hypothetical protein